VHAEHHLPHHRPQPAARDVFDAIEAGCADGYLYADKTPEVERMLAMGPAAFRRTVAKDAARDQERRVTELRHPLVLRRWKTALDELAQMTAPLARASSITALGPLPVDLDSLPAESAFAVLNARRFFVALQQRSTDCARTAREAAHTITRREDDEPEQAARRHAFERALRQLADERPEAYTHIRHRLRRHETSPGRLDEAALTATARGELKRQVLAELTGTSGSPRPPRQACHLRPSRAPAACAVPNR
jgi:hypothetical protein